MEAISRYVERVINALLKQCWLEFFYTYRFNAKKNRFIIPQISTPSPCYYSVVTFINQEKETDNQT